MGLSGAAADPCASTATEAAANVANRKENLLVTWTSLGMRSHRSEEVLENNPRNESYQHTLLRPKKFRETSARRCWLDPGTRPAPPRRCPVRRHRARRRLGQRPRRSRIRLPPGSTRYGRPARCRADRRSKATE